jgi:putative transposase
VFRISRSDEVVIKIAGTTHWLWRAVDQHGIVLDVLVDEDRLRHDQGLRGHADDP